MELEQLETIDDEALSEVSGGWFGMCLMAHAVVVGGLLLGAGIVIGMKTAAREGLGYVLAKPE